MTGGSTFQDLNASCCARACSQTTARARRCSPRSASWPKTATAARRQGRTLPNGVAFTESLNSRHVDGGFVGRWLAFDNRVLAVRGSYMRRSQDRRFGLGGRARRAQHVVRRSRPFKAATAGRRGWAGAAFQQDRHALRELPQFDYRFSSPSIFMQDEIAISEYMDAGRQRTR